MAKKGMGYTPGMGYQACKVQSNGIYVQADDWTAAGYDTEEEWLLSLGIDWRGDPIRPDDHPEDGIDTWSAA